MYSEADTMCVHVNLFISGRNLANMDTFGKSDPSCQILEQINGEWKRRGKTEQI